jgi:hypothetical protein
MYNFILQTYDWSALALIIVRTQLKPDFKGNAGAYRSAFSHSSHSKVSKIICAAIHYARIQLNLKYSLLNLIIRKTLTKPLKNLSFILLLEHKLNVFEKSRNQRTFNSCRLVNSTFLFTAVEAKLTGIFTSLPVVGGFLSFLCLSISCSSKPFEISMRYPLKIPGAARVTWNMTSTFLCYFDRASYHLTINLITTNNARSKHMYNVY